jgi:hypothetical protein
MVVTLRERSLIHESSTERKQTTIERRPATSMAARKSAATDSSSSNALRERVGNQGLQRLMAGRAVSASAESPQSLFPSVPQSGAGESQTVVQRKVDEESFAKLGGKIEEVGDTSGGGAGEGTAESNEFLLWNYHVGDSEPQAEHKKYLKRRC